MHQNCIERAPPGAITLLDAIFHKPRIKSGKSPKSKIALAMAGVTAAIASNSPRRLEPRRSVAMNKMARQYFARECSPVDQQDSDALPRQ